MKQRTKRIILPGLLLLSALLFVLGLQPQPAAARPLIMAAAAGQMCDLPDGSDNGQIAKDNQTCCPADTLKGDGSVDPIRCLYAKYINPVISLLSALVGVVVIVAIVYGAIEYTTSGGDPQRIAAGKKRIIEALIGLVAFMLLYAFLQFLVPGGLFS